jgi:hypothetical protein
VLQGQFLEEVQAGAQCQPASEVSVGLEFTHRAVGRIIEDSTSDFRGSYWVTNPGVPGGQVDFTQPDGSQANPTRLYDALTPSLHKAFGRGTLLEASYTLSSLRGNYDGLFALENSGQLMPNANSTAEHPDGDGR